MELRGSAFSASGIESIRIPSTLRVIGRNAFRGCRYLRGIALPEGLERIGQTAFADSGLRSLVCPGSLRKVGQGAFYMCRELGAVALNEGREVLDTGESPKRVEFAEGTESLGDGFAGIFGDSVVREVVFPGTLREVSPRVFEGCGGLQTVLVARGCSVDVGKFVGSSVRVQRK